jgi:adenine-specific DNA-methyltransferase
MRRAPEFRAMGVEKNPVMAIAAAINIAATRRELGRESGRELGGGADSGDRIYVGDGLSADAAWCEWEGRAAAVLGNPPYLREKGHRDVFRDLKERHGHLAPYFCARMDLQYLFFHRSASFVRPAGRLIFVTSAYWLSATNARNLRRDLAERLQPELLLRVETGGIFADAPGQHTLLSVFRRPENAGRGGVTRAISLEREPADWSAVVDKAMVEQASLLHEPRDDIFEHDSAGFGAEVWSPFADARTVRWGERLGEKGTRVAELLLDRQGFVSGADRFTARHRKIYEAEGASADEIPRKGAPIFLFERSGDVPESLARLGSTVIRPVLRASKLRPNEIYFRPPGDDVALYLDGELAPEQESVLAEHLGRFRPVLERRREVQSGIMPWYRLHWPRDRAEQTGPKLVVPRRAARPCFALDLSAGAISSDCTYLVLGDSSSDHPLVDLIFLMVALNSPVTERYLRHFGKTKGRQLEFYSEPLRSLPLPICREESGAMCWNDELIDEQTRDECDEAVEKLLRKLPPGLRRGE